VVSGLDRVDQSGEAGNFSRSGSFVQNTLLGCFSNNRFRGVQFGRRLFASFLTGCHPDAFHHVFDTGSDCFVPHPTNFILAGAFDRGFVIRQSSFSFPVKGSLLFEIKLDR